MKKLLPLLLCLFTTPLFAQQGVAVSIRSGTTDPAKCTPSSTNVFYNRSAMQLRLCTAANTWTDLLNAAVTPTVTSPLLLQDGSAGFPSMGPVARSDGFFFNVNGFGYAINGLNPQAITFDLSSISAGVTRSILVPNRNVTLADTGAGQTFTGNNFLAGVSLASGSTARVAADFTLAANTSLQTITGLSWVLPANTAANYPFRCELIYSQATAVVADQFGIQAASLAPTNIMAKADVNISASTFTAANLPTLTTTTATAIVTFTPSAITTKWNARIAGMIENPSGVANTINIMAQTSNSADLVTVYKDSYCVLGF